MLLEVNIPDDIVTDIRAHLPNNFVLDEEFVLKLVKKVLGDLELAKFRQELVTQQEDALRQKIAAIHERLGLSR